MGARGGSRTLGVVVFSLCLLWCFHSPMVPFSTCGSQCPIPIRHSPALGCSQQAPATVWIPKSPGGDPKLSLVSTSRVRAPGQGVHGLGATPAVPWGSLGWIWICSCSDHEEQPLCQEVVNPKNRVGLGITKSCDGPAAFSHCPGPARWDRRALSAPEHGPTGLLSTKTHKPSLSSIASLITQMRPLCLARPRRSRRCSGAAPATPFPFGSIFLFIDVKFPSFSMPRT